MPSHYHCFELNQVFIAAVCHMMNQWLSLSDLPLDCKTQCACCGFRNVFGQSQSFLCSRLQSLFSTDFQVSLVYFSYLFFLQVAITYLLHSLKGGAPRGKDCSNEYKQQFLFVNIIVKTLSGLK